MNTDNFMDAAPAGSATTLASPGKALGATTINLTSATGWPTATGVAFAMRRVDTKGNPISGTYTEWAGVLSGSTISNMLLLIGDDQAYAADGFTQVYVPVSYTAWHRLITTLLTVHNQDGTFKSGVIAAANMANNSVGTSALQNGSVTPDKLFAALRTASVLTQESTSSTTATDLATPGPSVTVTIGQNKLALVLWNASFFNTAAGQNFTNMYLVASGANTIAAGEYVLNQKQNQNSDLQAGNWALVSLSNTGDTTFGTKYDVSGGTGTWSNRHIAVIPL